MTTLAEQKALMKAQKAERAVAKRKANLALKRCAPLLSLAADVRANLADSSPDLSGLEVAEEVRLTVRAKARQLRIKNVPAHYFGDLELD